MNVGQIKVFCWLSAVLLTGFLSFYVWNFVRHLEQLRRAPDTDKIRAALEESEPPKIKAQDLVAYADVTRLFLQSCQNCKSNPNCHHMNWTGKIVIPAATTTAAAPEKPAAVPVKDLIRVLMVQVDLSDRKQSFVFIRYTSKSGLQNTGSPPGFLLHEGDHLSPPHDKAHIETIGADGVVFAFDDAGREKETLGPAEFDAKTQIVQVSPDGVVLPSLKSSITRGKIAPFDPAHTTAIGRDKYVLGHDDMKYLNDNYAAELANHIRWERHQDPRTGKYDGIEIKEVAPGSLAEAHGAQEGDVIKSINGHPVTSVQEAITYAKTNAGKFTTWEIVVDSQGKTKTITYTTPQQ
jgi:hypothetical protein